MLKADRIKQRKQECRLKGIEESPLNFYHHEVDYPHHARKISSMMWSNLTEEKRKLSIDFGQERKMLKVRGTNDYGVKFNNKNSLPQLNTTAT